MLKLCLCVLLLVLCGGAGLIKAGEFSNRLRHLQDLIAALKALQSEMTFRKDPLPRLLLRGKEWGKDLAGEFFYSIGHSLELLGHSRLEDAWREHVELIYGDSSLKPDDMDILKELSVELGQTDLASQEAMFQRTFFLLEKQEKSADAEKRVKGRMYRALGLAVGALLVIALV